MCHFSISVMFLTAMDFIHGRCVKSEETSFPCFFYDRQSVFLHPSSMQPSSTEISSEKQPAAILPGKNFSRDYSLKAEDNYTHFIFSPEWLYKPQGCLCSMVSSICHSQGSSGSLKSMAKSPGRQILHIILISSVQNRHTWLHILESIVRLVFITKM